MLVVAWPLGIFNLDAKKGNSVSIQSTCTENWKDLFQPQSVDSALQAKVSPSWSHLSTI